jgi:hypothetical protein
VGSFKNYCGTASASLPTSHDLVESIGNSRDLDTTLSEANVDIVELPVN